MNALSEIKREAFAALRPPPILDLADWTEANVRLPSDIAAEAGPMRLFAWQRGFARSIADPTVERVTLMKAARVGATQLMVAGIAHYALNDPSPQLVVMPSEADCKMMLTGIIEPTFASSPALRSALTENTSGRDTMLSRRYPGGSLALVSGGSPKNLRARTARIAWLDEVDGLELSAGAEGDPVALTIRRTMSYGARRKIIMASTPVDEETSRIQRAYLEGDQRVWELPCPHCWEFHEITWKDIQWPTGKPEAAAYVCPSCGAITEETDKHGMIQAGRWRPTRPEITSHHSYRLSTFGASTISTASWGALAVEFVAAKRDAHLLKTWVNTVAGQVWREDSDSLDDSDLAARCEAIGLDRIPPEVIALTAGCDVQPDRLEISSLGWTAEGLPIVLEHAILWGDVYADEVWRELSDLLRRSHSHPNGGTLKYDACLVDSGDGNTSDIVYQFTNGRYSNRIFPCKGVGGWKEAPVRLGNAAGKKHVRLQLVGVDGIKWRILHLCQSNQIRFSDTLSESWFEQLASEKLRVKYSRGSPVREWHKLGGRRSEALDCCVYAIAARSLVNIDADRRAAELSSAAAPKVAPKVFRSNWLDR